MIRNTLVCVCVALASTLATVACRAACLPGCATNGFSAPISTGAASVELVDPVVITTSCLCRTQRPGTQIEDVEVTINGSAIGSPRLYVWGGSLGKLKITNNTSFTVRLYLGSQPGLNPNPIVTSFVGPIGQVYVDPASTANEPVWLVYANVTGDIGHDAGSSQFGIDVDTVAQSNEVNHLMTVNGSIKNGIRIRGQDRSISDLRVTGNFEGNISFSNANNGTIVSQNGGAQIAKLAIDGELKGPSNGVRSQITGLNTITELSVSGRLFADITLALPNATQGGFINRVFVGGDFDGSLSARGFTTFGISPASTFQVNGNLAASVTLLNQFNSSSMAVSGSIPPTRLVNNVNTANVITLSAPLSSSPISVVGNIAGNVHIAGIPVGSTFNANGGLSGSMNIDGALAGTLRIGGSLTGSVSLPANGLAGTVFVNANNNTGGSWTGNLTVGGVSLSPKPAYAQLPASLGGGRVIFVPYYVYWANSTPAQPALGSPIPALSGHQSVVTTDFETSGNNNAVPLKIRFFGPVASSSGFLDQDVVIEGTPLTNAANPCASGITWQTVTSGFLIRPSSDPLINDSSGRTIGLSRASSSTHIGAGLFRVKFPGLVSQNAIGTPVVKSMQYCSGMLGTDAFYFRIGPDCDGDGLDDSDPNIDPDVSGNCATGCADFNNAGGVTVQDIFDFLDAWFSNCTHYEPNGPCRYGSADFNGVGGVSVQDIFDFIEAWFAGDANCQ